MSCPSFDTAGLALQGGEKRHDYSVVGNVEFLSAPRPVEEPEAKPAKAARSRKEPVAA